MQVLPETDLAGLVERLVANELPAGRGIRAWQSLLRAHATLMRQLESDLEQQTGLALADYDVLAQLAIADGELRMTELANRALISRSGMTRRVARLVDAEIEVDRYTIWPGQALSYKIGQREIERARREVSELLGDRFNLRTFHDEVLGHGSLPLATLRREIPGWVETAVAATEAAPAR
ncbi:MAG: DUF885 domain-containing protein [Chloroflexi bacterium]|nr:MAG: DUF885 domain-containing protein [Chloroflexota bacterium]